MSDPLYSILPSNASFASNGLWHDNMLNKEMLIMDHHQRISHRGIFFSSHHIKEGLFDVSRRNIRDRFALEDLHGGAAVDAMVGAIPLDFVDTKLWQERSVTRNS